MYSFKGWRNNKNHAFPSKRCISNGKRISVRHFTTKIIRKYLYVTCNKKILFVKKSLPIEGIHRLLHSSCCFLNTNTAITLQLIRTARTLEAEWWQVCGEAWVQGQRKISQVLGAFGLLDFTMLRPIVAWRAFWNVWTIYFFNFPIFSGRGKLRITETAVTESAVTGVRLYFFLGFIHFVTSKQNTKFWKLDVCRFYANIWAGTYWAGSDSKNSSTLLFRQLCVMCERSGTTI